MDAFGSRLKTAQLARAMIQQELPRLSDVQVSTISRLENDASGKDGPRGRSPRRSKRKPAGS